MTIPDRNSTAPGAPEQIECEQEWATRIRTGDETAFAALFRAYYPGLCTYIYAYVRSGALAEELVMDVFRKLWEGRERWVVRGTVRAYLFSAAHHTALDHLRHGRLEQRLAQEVNTNTREVPALGRPPSGPVQDVERAELAAAIARVVDDLPERCRAVFLLWWQHDLKYAEIAAILDVSVKTIETHLARAAKVLRTRLAIFRS